jgi:peptidoglycan hydrolase-like protein with peptidoglycan-binding domain
MMNLKQLGVFSVASVVMMTCLTAPLPASASFTRYLSVGSEGSDVYDLQKILKNEGYYTYPDLTGFYGSVTAKAVLSYQEDHGLEPVGSVGPRTRELLNLTAPVATASFSRTLSIGSKGPDVLALQMLLKTQGFFTHPDVTEYYGPITAKAVAAFQVANGLESIGRVGPLTRAKLNEEAARSISSSVVTTNTPGISTSNTTSTTLPSTATANAPSIICTAGPGFSCIPGTNIIQPYVLGAGYTPGFGGGGSAAATTIAPAPVAPVISALAAAFGTPATTSLVITWTTDVPATTQLEYGTTASYGSLSTLDATLSTSHTVTLTGLTPNTTYYYRARSKDSVDTLAISTGQQTETDVLTQWKGLGQAMSTTINGFTGGTNWSNLTRSRHYSNARFRKFRVAIQTFYPAAGAPISDTNFANSYDFQVGFEYPYTAANTGLAARVPVTFSASTSALYTPGAGPYGYILSDEIDLGYWVPANAFFGLWTTIENKAHGGSNTIPVQTYSTNYVPRNVGYYATNSSLINANLAFSTTSIVAAPATQIGAGNYFAPSLMLIETDSSVPTIAVTGDSIAYGVGEGNSGSGATGDTLGNSLGNAGYIARGIFENLGANMVSVARATDGHKFHATTSASSWVYRKQIMALSNPDYIIDENGFNDTAYGFAVSNWAGNTAYAKYMVRTANGNQYMCITAGTSAASGGPSGTGTDITDGTAHWAYIQADPGTAGGRSSAYNFSLIADAHDQLKAAMPGVPIYQALITPNAASTDSFATIVNQTANTFANQQIRRTFINNYIKSLNPLLSIDGYFDANQYIENDPVTPDSKWVVNGVSFYLTQDGAHPNSVGHATAAGAFTSGILQ